MMGTVLVVEPEEQVRRQLIVILKEYELEPLTAFQNAEVREVLAETAPVALMVNAAVTGFINILEEYRRRYPLHPLIVLCEPPQVHQLTTGLKAFRPYVMALPLTRTALENTLVHIMLFVAMHNHHETTEANIEKRIHRGIAAKIAGERFLAVQQIVDKMSDFISLIASDAQGGLKFFDQMPYFVAIHDQNCRVLTANQTYTQHLGNRINKNSWGIYSGRLGRQNTCPVAQTIRTGRILKTHGNVKYQSGAQVPVIVHTAPILNEAGQVELILEVLAGSKEIDRLAEEITTTQQRYQQLFDAAPNYIVVLDRKLRATTINRQFKEVFGDLTGRSFYDLFRECSPPMLRCPIAQTVTDGLPHQGEMILRTRMGNQYNMMVWTSPIVTPAGKLLQVLAIFADITELRKLQDNLASLGLMMGTLSHSLKGSLTGLDAGMFLIESGFYRNKQGQIEEGLDVTKLMIERIRKMVFNVLYYAKEREPDLERVSVLHFAGDIAANIEPRIRGAAIHFETDYAPDLGDFEIDTGLVRTALVNILENAIEACLEDTRDRSHRIDFRVRSDGEYVVFDIADTAGGMSEEQRRQIFDLFYSSKGHKGTGLGLFIAKKVIQKHGGSIGVNSEPGRGTTFQVRLPHKVKADTRPSRGKERAG
jgi:PAS domain S-box-containing protein